MQSKKEAAGDGGHYKGAMSKASFNSPLTLDISRLPTGAHILVAVSGGADSMALLHALHALARRQKWRLTVAHLNHGIRGSAAIADAAFVKKIAQRLRVDCVIGQTRVPALARQSGTSLEMAAREARYAFLLRTARKVKADIIATAHTANDQAETVLLKLLRGAGRAGLSGMSPETPLQGVALVRPMLAINRASILAYLRKKKVAWKWWRLTCGVRFRACADSPRIVFGE